jgi:general secretion pathway protein N
MNAADRRRLTPVLAAVAVLLTLLLMALWAGLGRGAQWHDRVAPERIPVARPPARPPPVPPLRSFAEVWRRPLFNPGRQPDSEAAPGGQAADAGDLELTGVILTPDLHMALLREKSSGRTFRVLEGESAGNAGPTLVELHPRSAVIETSSSRQHLQLKPEPAAGGEAGSAPSGAQPPQAAPRGVRSAAGPPRAMFTPPGRQGAHAQSPTSSVSARVRELKARIDARRRAQHKDGG